MVIVDVGWKFIILSGISNCNEAEITVQDLKKPFGIDTVHLHKMIKIEAGSSCLVICNC